MTMTLSWGVPYDTTAGARSNSKSVDVNLFNMVDLLVSLQLSLKKLLSTVVLYRSFPFQ